MSLNKSDVELFGGAHLPHIPTPFACTSDFECEKFVEIMPQAKTGSFMLSSVTR